MFLGKIDFKKELNKQVKVLSELGKLRSKQLKIINLINDEFPLSYPEGSFIVYNDKVYIIRNYEPTDFDWLRSRLDCINDNSVEIKFICEIINGLDESATRDLKLSEDKKFVIYKDKQIELDMDFIQKYSGVPKFESINSLKDYIGGI